MIFDTMISGRVALELRRLTATPVVDSLRRPLIVTSLVAALGCAGLAQAGDPEAGSSKSATCAECHGTQGQSDIAPTNPILAGQYESYLVNALQSYRSGARDNAIMKGLAAQLSDEDIADLAAYFSSQPGPLQTAPSK